VWVVIVVPLAGAAGAGGAPPSGGVEGGGFGRRAETAALLGLVRRSWPGHRSIALSPSPTSREVAIRSSTQRLSERSSADLAHPAKASSWARRIKQHQPLLSIETSLHGCYTTLTQRLIIPISYKPPVSLDIMSWVASICGDTRGEIAPRVAQACTAHVATPRGLAACPHHRHPLRAQPVASMRECHRGRPRRTRAVAPLRYHTARRDASVAAQRRRNAHALHIPRDARPAHLSSFRFLAMALPPLDARQKLLL
jgi:hypothetical protein